MKDSQPSWQAPPPIAKYIKANNERFSTHSGGYVYAEVSISRRIMKDSQPMPEAPAAAAKYIKANNERFSTDN